MKHKANSMSTLLGVTFEAMLDLKPSSRETMQVEKSFMESVDSSTCTRQEREVRDTQKVMSLKVASSSAVNKEAATKMMRAHSTPYVALVQSLP